MRLPSGGRQSERDLERVINRATLRQRRTTRALAQSLSLQQLRHDIRRAIVRADVMHDQDVRMIKRARGASFLLEPMQAIRVGGEGRRKNFDCDISSQSCVACAINLAHPARAER